MKTKSFAFRLSIYILLFTTILAGISFSIYYYITRKIYVNTAKENAINITLSTVNEIEIIFRSVEKIPLNLVKVIENSNLDSTNLVKLMRSIVEGSEEIYGSAVAFEPNSFIKSKYFYSPYVYKENGVTAFVDLGNPEYNYPVWDWYKVPKELNSAIWSEPYFDKGGGDILMSTFSVPFYKYKNGEKIFWGIVTIDISLEWLEDIIAGVKIFNTGYAFLLSGEGNVVTHPNRDYIMNSSIFSIAEKFNQPELNSIGMDMKSGQSNLLKLNRFENNEDIWISYKSLPSNGWSLAIAFTEDELFADLRFLQFALLIISIIGGAFLFALIISVAQRLTKPLTVLAEATKSIGSGNFDITLPTIQTKDEVGKLHDSFAFMLKELKIYVDDLKHATVEKEKIASELRIAHEIQMGMVPKIFPPFPNNPEIDLYALIDPAKEVGGDLYDFFFLDDSHLCFAIGDVTGKGVPASLFMAVTRTLLRSKAIKGMKANEIVHEVNLDLTKDNESQMFVTFFLGILNIHTGILSFTNAGHNSPYVVKANGEVVKVDVNNGLPLGVFAAKEFSMGNLFLMPRDKFVLYTDGVNEAMNPEFELFTAERLESSLEAVKNLNPRECIEKIVADITAFTKGADQSDDITLLVLQYNR
ncbi:MAG: SpoIIE family protein phosphatase [Bacteroidetes bacterium]|nr:SpoIIE family protein phosphatase [Bacteroidota bacterium]